MSVASSRHLGINVFGFQDTLFVILMDLTFISYAEAGSDLNSLSPQHESCCHTSAVCNAACGNDRNRYCVNHLRNQRHGRCLSDMSAGLGTLCNHRICTAALHTFCESYGSDNRDDFDIGSFPLFHILLRASCTSSNGCNLLLYHYLSNICRIGTHEHDVHTERLICHLFCFPDIIPNYLCRCIGCTDDSEAACIGDRCCQMRLCHPGHTALNNRFLHS